MQTNTYSSINFEEIEKFSRIAEEWWDESGKFAILHRINPVRLEFITSRLAHHFGRDRNSNRYLSGLSVLDIGCGGGLLAEPLARLGANVTGIDASQKNTKVAALHAEKMGLHINYQHNTVEELKSQNLKFDVILNMEVIEHVDNPEVFISDCCSLLNPGGAMVIATLNRTLKSLMLAKVGAEYVLRWVPTGTHVWGKFLKPHEISYWLRAAGMTVDEIQGMTFSPLSNTWHITPDTSMNYLMFVTRHSPIA